jgi:long-subunit fatty acid transport protein
VEPTLRKLAVAITLLFVLSGCGNRYYHDLGDIYEPVRLHLGEANDTIGARAAGIAGAGGTAADSPAAVVQNPAGLTELESVAFEGGFGYENRALRWQADSSYPTAEASTNSFNGSYAAFGLPVVKNRLYLGAAYWVPYDLKLTAGDRSDGGYVESDGVVRSITPGFAVAVGPVAAGFSTDILWGGQDFDTTAPVDSFDVGFFGYDLRAGLRYEKRYKRGWGFAAGAVARRGARLNVSDGVSYSLDFGPQIGVAGSLLYKRFSLHGDYVYNFAERSASDDGVTDYALERITRDAPYYMLGFEYSLGEGVVRGGFAVKPALVRDASRGSIDGLFYSVGGGWNAFRGRGFMDAALTYGRRGSINKNRFTTGYIDFFITVRYGL